MSLNINFINEEFIKSRTAVSVGIDGKQLKPVIKLAQDKYILPALGSNLYNRLQAGVENDDLNLKEIDLMNNYIADALLWFTMGELVTMTSFQFFSKGVFQKTSEESNAPSKGQLELLERRYISNGEFYKQRLIDFLRANEADYPQYLSGVAQLDTIAPQMQAYTSPIFLGRKGKRIVSNYDYPCEIKKL